LHRFCLDPFGMAHELRQLTQRPGIENPQRPVREGGRERGFIAACLNTPSFFRAMIVGEPEPAYGCLPKPCAQLIEQRENEWQDKFSRFQREQEISRAAYERDKQHRGQ